MLNQKILILILIIIFLLSEECGMGKWIPSFDESTGSSNPQYGTSSLAQNFQINYPGTQNPETSSGGGNFVQEGNPIIKRRIAPNYKDFYLKNSIYNVEVEIQGSGRSFDDLLIKEKIDQKLGKLSNLTVYVVNSFDSSKRPVKEAKSVSQIKDGQAINLMKEMGENYTICDDNKTIYIKIKKLELGQDISYNYNIKSNQTGIFEILTRLRINNSRWADLEKIDPIDVRPPEIEVATDRDKSYAICYKPLNVTYGILFKNGWCNEDTKLQALFNTSEEYDIYLNGSKYTGKKFNITVKPLELKEYPVKIEYKNAGLHPIPAISIEGATVYQKNEDIDVFVNDFTKFLQDNAILFSIIISIFAICISTFELLNARRERDFLSNIALKIAPSSVYTKIMKEQRKSNHLQIFIYIYLLLSLVWIACHIILSSPILLLISLPIILLIALTIQYKRNLY